LKSYEQPDYFCSFACIQRGKILFLDVSFLNILSWIPGDF